jgi:endonuclease/exonuclease/phosphatase family metal-dependent hydrolase
MTTRNLLGALLCGMLLGAGNFAQAQSGTFTTLSYNIAGLPEIFSSLEPGRKPATRRISCYLNAFDIVHVQEDYSYHAALYGSCADHPYRSPTSGGFLFGSGLNTLSRFPYRDWARVAWHDCAGVDCLLHKGFTLARTRLAEGVSVDIYNLHAQARSKTSAQAARRGNILQLAAYIEAHSAGNAVIVMGDTNGRYTRDGDNLQELLRRGFTDAWISLIRGGEVPRPESGAPACEPPVTRPDCEVVDKVFYRDNGVVGLRAVGYRVRQDALDAAGRELSDHRPIQVDWIFDTDPKGRDAPLENGNAARSPAECNRP